MKAGRYREGELRKSQGVLRRHKTGRGSGKLDEEGGGTTENQAAENVNKYVEQ